VFCPEGDKGLSSHRLTSSRIAALRYGRILFILVTVRPSAAMLPQAAGIEPLSNRSRIRNCRTFHHQIPGRRAASGDQVDIVASGLSYPSALRLMIKAS